MSANNNLIQAKIARNDEYYTRLSDIELELQHYPDVFKGKIIYLPCDDRSKSMFWKYFKLHAEELEWSKLIATCMISDGNGKKSVASFNDGVLSVEDFTLDANGDFLSQECIDLLDECDIVVTNLPFSMFRKYVNVMMEHTRDFIVIGGKNGGKYQDTIGYVISGKMRLGFNEGHGTMTFVTSEGKENSVGAYWFTTLPSASRKLILSAEYDPDKYPRYANYDAIEISKVSEIPKDYFGKMGVPVTFLEFYDPDDWILYGTNATVLEDAPQDPYIKARSHLYRRHNLYLAQSDGTFKRMYDRLIVQRKKA